MILLFDTYIIKIYKNKKRKEKVKNRVKKNRIYIMHKFNYYAIEIC